MVDRWAVCGAADVIVMRARSLSFDSATLHHEANATGRSGKFAQPRPPSLMLSASTRNSTRATNAGKTASSPAQRLAAPHAVSMTAPARERGNVSTSFADAGPFHACENIGATVFSVR